MCLLYYFQDNLNLDHKISRRKPILSPANREIKLLRNSWFTVHELKSIYSLSRTYRVMIMDDSYELLMISTPGSFFFFLVALDFFNINHFIFYQNNGLFCRNWLIHGGNFSHHVVLPSLSASLSL